MWRNGDVVTFYTHDGNKNVSEVIKFNGITGAHYEYAPFGVVAKQYGDCAVVNPWRFSSECADVLLGMMYFNYRCYGYFTGRWFSRDPVEELGILLPVDYDVDMKEETLKYEMLILQYIKIADRFGDQDGLHKAIEAYSLNRQRQDVQNVDMSKKLQPCYLYIFNRPCGMFDDRGLKTVVVGSSIAVGCALADGPFPIGDIVAIGIIACCVMNNPPEIPRCPPPPSPPPPEVHSVSNQHGCPLAHWHYFVYHQAPWPLCINRLKRNFGGCIPPKPGQMPPPNE